MQVFHIQGDQFTELDTLPDKLPATGYLWVGSARREFARLARPPARRVARA